MTIGANDLACIGAARRWRGESGGGGGGLKTYGKHDDSQPHVILAGMCGEVKNEEKKGQK